MPGRPVHRSEERAVRELPRGHRATQQQLVGPGLLQRLWGGAQGRPPPRLPLRLPVHRQGRPTLRLHRARRVGVGFFGFVFLSRTGLPDSVPTSFTAKVAESPSVSCWMGGCLGGCWFFFVQGWVAQQRPSQFYCQGGRKSVSLVLGGWVLLFLSKAGLHNSVPASLLPRWQKVRQSRAGWVGVVVQGRVARQRTSQFYCQGGRKSVSLVQLSPDDVLTSTIGWTTSAMQTHLFGTVTVLILSVPWSPVGSQQVQPWRRVGLGICRAA